MSGYSDNPSASSNEAIVLLRGLAGAVVGGIAGYFIFRWLWTQGFYGIMIPGALLGIGAGFAAGGKSHALPLVCLFLAIGLTLFTEWHVLYSKSHSFTFFIANVHTLKPIKHIMMTLGVICAVWFARGR
jgi:hypothetical protein